MTIIILIPLVHINERAHTHADTDILMDDVEQSTVKRTCVQRIFFVVVVVVYR